MNSRRLAGRALATMMTMSCATPKPPPPAIEAPPPKPPELLHPETRAEAISEQMFGTEVKDPFRWLEDVKSPEVQAWMKAQDDSARGVLRKLPGRDELTKRFTELFYADSIGAPVKRGNRLFYRRTHANKEKAVVYWKEGDAGEEKVLLDPNAWSAEGTVSLGVWVPSWDGSKVAFAKRANNSDEATLHVLDVASGQISEVDVIAGGKYASPSWTPDSKGFYYEYLPTDASIPVDQRPGYTEARFHALGMDPAKDPVVHPATKNPASFLGVQLSRDGRYLFVTIQRGWNENDIFWKDLRSPRQTEWQLLVAGHDATYSLEAWKDAFYVVTDEGAPRRRIFKVLPAKPARKD